MSAATASADLPEVPDNVVTFDGQRVKTASLQWRMLAAADGGGVIIINWQRLREATVAGRPIFSEQAEKLVRLYLADRLTRRKCHTVHNDFLAFLALARWLARQPDAEACVNFDWSQYDEAVARGFLAWCETHSAINGIHFSRLRVFYEWGVAREYADFDLRFLRILKAIPSSANAKGHHVRFRHVTKGPFSPLEKHRLIQAIKARCGADEDRAVIMLHLELGLNPGATARLVNGDLVHVHAQQGDFYQLAVPRMKKRSARRETKRRPISPTLGRLLQELQQGETHEPLLHWLSAHSPRNSINAALKRFVADANIISPRTGKRLEVTARRFRYTLATHLAVEGASKFHLAEVLDHSDLQNVEVYVETTPAIAGPVAAATDQVLEPLVRRFLGKVVESSDDPLVPAQTPHLPLPLLKVGGVGACGRDIQQDGLCRLFPPLSCYLCPSFAALRGGPHEALLANIDAFITASADHVDQRIRRQLDEVRSAIAEVVAQCATAGEMEEVLP